MRRFLVLTLLLIVATMGTAFAAVGDSRSDTAALYGEYRIVIDTDNQLWTRADWEASGQRYAKEASKWHQFSRNDQSFQMVVAYETEKPDSIVQIQRFTPQNSFKLSDLKTYFPEVYKLVNSPKAVVFGTDDKITAHFLEGKPEVYLGVVVKESPIPDKDIYYSLLSFNIVQDGRIVKNVKQINSDTLIREFVIERVFRSDVDEKLHPGNGWIYIPNYFN